MLFALALCIISVFFCYTIKYFKKGNSENRILVIALSIIILSTFFVFGGGVANAGTACRHRDKLVIVCGILLALIVIIRNIKQWPSMVDIISMTTAKQCLDIY